MESKPKTIKHFHSIHDVLDSWLRELNAAPDFETAKQRLQSFRHAIEIEVDYYGPQIKRVGHKQYDDLIETLFKATNQAIPKEALLELFLNELYSLEHPTSALCAFVLEAISDGHRYYYYAGEQRGIHEDRWKKFSDNILPKLSYSQFLQQILIAKQSIELWHVQYIENYDGELDSLVSEKDEEFKHKTIRRKFWLNAVSLPSSSSSYPNRALFILYQDKGTEDMPRLPQGANQEWRSLHFLSIAYKQLEHQLRNVAAEVYKQRQTLLNSLAPGILHHEIGHQIQAIDDNIELQKHIASRLLETNNSEDMQRLAFCIQLLQDASKRLYEITDAFNALERRRMGERFQLDNTFKELSIICKNRLEKSIVSLEYDEQESNITLTSDPALLLQLFINIVINAANAIDKWAKNLLIRPPHYQIQIKVIYFDYDEELLIAIENNGPPIPKKIQGRIFEKGFTSYADGHGQGLSICQLIAQYLGGSLELMSEKNLSSDMNVGFQLKIPIEMPSYQDLGSNI